MYKSSYLSIAVLSVLGVLAIPASATSLTALPPGQVGGDLALGGSSATVGATFLNFLCNVTLGQPCSGTYGDFNTIPVTDGSFSPYQNTLGYIQSINESTDPINTPFVLNNFLYLATGPSGTPAESPFTFQLTFIYPGFDGQSGCTEAPAPGEVCTPVIAALVTAANPDGLSPFNLQDTNSGFTANFNVAGNVINNTDGSVSPFTGTFSATFNGTSYQADLATIATGGTVTNPYSATFTATVVPEPMTFSLFGIGLLALGLCRRK
jgi:hypothetical protein